MKYDVVALGELLVDFTQNGLSGQGNTLYVANPGGAPCNVLAMLQKLGHQTAFIGKVGKDQFGQMLASEVAREGIDTSYLRFDEAVHTTLAFVHTMPDGDRDFSFYRNPGADMMLSAEEIPEEAFANTRAFHFGTLSMTHPGVCKATEHALSLAKKHDLFRSFDPNLRPPLWNSMNDARDKVRFGLANCDLLKIADNELTWLTGEIDFTAGVKAIRKEFDIPLILVSMGRDGSRAYTRNAMVEAPPFRTDRTIEATGAGDTFCACMLHAVLTEGLEAMDEARLQSALRLANAAASLVTTRRGALRVMPELKEIERWMAQF